MTTRNVYVVVVPVQVNYERFSKTFNTQKFETLSQFEEKFDEYVQSTGASNADDFNNESGMESKDFHFYRLHDFINLLNSGERDPFDDESDRNMDDYFFAYATIYDVDQ